MRIKRIISVMALFTGICAAASGEKNMRTYLVAERPAPVLNTRDFRSVFGGKDAKTLKLDKEGLVREVEFIALPGTVFEVAGKSESSGRLIYKVTTEDYPYPSAGGYYVDAGFVKKSLEKPPKRAPKLPHPATIIRRMVLREGARYVWGGNCAEGIPEMLAFYPPSGKISRATGSMWTLKGLDCTGLLYEATGGATPRNTGTLTTFGKPVLIRGLSAADIAAELEPLDLIVWKGHVVIVIDNKRVIQSRLDYDPEIPGNQDGVRIEPAEKVLSGIMSERVPVDSYDEGTAGGKKKFVVRRWI
jgi:cell wall-associated NlpC family hydrolase